MNFMEEYLFQSYNTPFLYALYFLAFILAIEIISLVIGIGISELISLDSDVDVDLEIEHGFFGKFVSFIKVDNVPILILLIIYMATFSIFGFLSQSLSVQYFGYTFNLSLVVGSVAVIAFPIYKMIAKMMADKLFREETTAISEAEFLGRIATISTGTAKIGLPAEARFVDQHGQQHFVMVEPEDENVEFGPETEIELLRKEDYFYKAKRKL